VGDEPSWAMNTPWMNELSPMGKKAFGTMLNRYTVPPRQNTQINADTHRCRRKNHSERPYQLNTRRSMPPITRSIHVLFAPTPRWPRSREHISGVSVSDTMPLAKIDTMIV